MTDLNGQLKELLALTAEQQRIKRRIDLIRARVDQTVRTEFDRTGVAPTYKIPKAGQIRLDGCDPEPKPYVADNDALMAWVAGVYPSEIRTGIEVPTERISEAVQALEFAGIDVITTVGEIRDAFLDRLLSEVVLHDRHADLEDGATPPEGPRWIAFDAEGTEIPGVAGVAGGAPRLVVAVDPKVKASMVAEADAEDAALIETEQTEEKSA